MKSSTQLFAGIAIVVGINIAMILYLTLPFLTAKTIVLATRPVDPFDPLRGQYLTINYAISRIPAATGALQGSTVYVLLNENPEHVWDYASSSIEKPASGDFIAGQVESFNGNLMHVNYGIEQFFFENDAEFPRANLTVEVKVSSSGQGQISRLLVNATPYEFGYETPTLSS
jgi:uncharacterized membrane-anchored protein